MDPAPLHLLCIEPRFPGRLGAVADWLVRRRGFRCQFYCNAVDVHAGWPESVGHGLEVVQFNVGGAAREPAVEWTRQLERGLCYAYGCWEALMARRPWPVDLVLGRSAGLGSTLFTPNFQPGVPVVNFFDYYLHPRTGDLADEDRDQQPPAYGHWRRSANAMDLLDLENTVYPWVPTAWQRDCYPAEYRDDFLVLFDGIDARRFRRPALRSRTVAGRTIPDGTKVISFVARQTDRLRGFDRFLKLANALVRAGEDLVAVVIGDPVVHNGLDVRFFNQDYRTHALHQDPPPDPERLWFLGTVGPAVVVEVLTASDLHVYTSRPYPLSRSLLEAMAADCVVLAADSEPVREVLAHEQTGLLAQPDDLDSWVRQARTVLHDPAGHRDLARRAPALVRERYAQDVTLPVLAGQFHRLVERSSSRKTWNAVPGPVI